MCKRLHIPFGVYLFSYATTLDEMRSEVNHTLRLIKNKKLEYPVFLDVESKRQMILPKKDLVELVKYYCEELQKEGYYVGIYSSLNRFNSNLDSRELDPFDKWVAEWNEEFTYKGKAGMWQHTAYEELAGIRTRVDGDIAFLDYPKIIREANLNHLQENLKFKKGDKLYLTGDIYEESNAHKAIERVCDEKVVIERVEIDKPAPYKIEKGFVKEENLYQKCE